MSPAPQSHTSSGSRHRFWRRLGWLAVAYCAASLAAALVALILVILPSEPWLFELTPFLVVVVVLATWIGLHALPPVALFIVYSESRPRRDAAFHWFAGLFSAGLVTAANWYGPGNFGELRANMGFEKWEFLSIAALSGLSAGHVYWSVAIGGRSSRRREGSYSRTGRPGRR